MAPIPFRRKPVSRALLLAVLLGATYIYGFIRDPEVCSNSAFLGLGLLLLIVYVQFCFFHYAQFIVPVRTLSDRLKIRRRLLQHARRAHGPAMFVQNGRRLTRRREKSASGPGLLWIDTASAVTTRSDTGPKQVLGPGIHFLAAGEQIASTFSLHTQTLSMGPDMDDPVFASLDEESTTEDRQGRAALQAKRVAVSGITRDGNEVVPQLQVVFRLDSMPAAPGMPGSRFGFSKEAVQRAARGEGITVDASGASPRHVSWNQLPGLIAVDLWREYLAKFTLDELFSPTFQPVADILQPEEPVRQDASHSRPPEPGRGWLTRQLWRLNNTLESRGVAAEDDAATSTVGQDLQPQTDRMRKMPDRQYTALEIIGHMVRARMMYAAVPTLDDCGRPAKGRTLSEEYKRLRERGVRILDVTIGGLRLDPAVEQQLAQQWKTAWMATAMGSRGHVEQLEMLAIQEGRQRALLEHASALAKALRGQDPTNIPSALRILLLTSQHEILADERLHGRGSEELRALSGLAKWVESPNDD